MTPWHLIPKDFRAYVLRVLDDMRHPAFASAAALLREAAPYEDDELVIRVSRYGEVGHVCGWVDEGDGAVMVEYITDGEHIEGAHLILCKPLTPAARDLLDALRGAP